MSIYQKMELFENAFLKRFPSTRIRFQAFVFLPSKGKRSKMLLCSDSRLSSNPETSSPLLCVDERPSRKRKIIRFLLSTHKQGNSVSGKSPFSRTFRSYPDSHKRCTRSHMIETESVRRFPERYEIVYYFTNHLQTVG